ncbi:butyrate kinase [candidate division KSB1 bacterium]
MKTLAINPGSTSTKIAVYDGKREIFTENIYHPTDELGKFTRIADQKKFRKNMILEMLKKKNININDFSAIVGRGGVLRPIEGGTYKVNKKMLDDLSSPEIKEHASNLGALIAFEIANKIKVDAYIADPVVVDEMVPIARITGIRKFNRLSIWHALNQKACAKRYARETGKRYEDLNLIVVHMGGGISIGSHKHGKVVDVNNALDGEGPFTPERSGTLPVGQLIDLCFSGEVSKEELKLLNKGKGGLISHLGTSSLIEVEERIDEGDENAKLIFEALCYQIAKFTSYSLPIFSEEKVHCIIFTGGMAKSERLIGKLKSYLSFTNIPFIVYKGENEMEALRDSLLAVLTKKEEAKNY